MKRHRALILFSRDHYVGLVHARRLLKAAAQDRVARHKALADFLDAWRADIAPHFRDEERLLVPLIAGGPDRKRLLDEHAALATLAEQAASVRQQVDPDPSFLADLGTFLERHIRWEERVVFQAVQAHATAEQLDALAEVTGKIERTRPRGRDGLAPEGRDRPPPGE
jgi:iron-sulfur cluster repair protein YtfE (RIC family)